MGRDYIPEKDAEARTWFEAFANGIQANPSLYMLTPAQATSISHAVDGFVAALSVSSSEATRNKGTVIAKDNARSVAQNMCRSYARLIKYNLGIDDSDKIGIGVPPVNPARNRRHVPHTSPALSMLGATPGVQVLTYKDSITQSRALPLGAVHLQLFMAIGDKTADRSQAQFRGSFTKNPIRVEHDLADAGKVATFYARWASQRGEFGPWSLATSMTIAA